MTKLISVGVLIGIVSQIGMNVYANPAPIGWSSDQITMGAAVSGGADSFVKDPADPSNTNNLVDRPVGAAFTYAGDGKGNRGQLVVPDAKVANFLTSVNQYDQQNPHHPNPVLVFYTADGSDGIDSIKQDLDIGTGTNNLYYHYVNLIAFAQEVEANYQQNKIRSTVILNPDFLGDTTSTFKVH